MRPTLSNCHGGSPTTAAPTVWTPWTTGAGTLVRPNMTGTLPVAGPVALTATHATDWDGGGSDEVQPHHSVCRNCHGTHPAHDPQATSQQTPRFAGGADRPRETPRGAAPSPGRRRHCR